MDPEPFDNLVRTVSALQLDLQLVAKPAPTDWNEDRVAIDLDVGKVLGPLVEAVIQLTRCVNELRQAIDE